MNETIAIMENPRLTFNQKTQEILRIAEQNAVKLEGSMKAAMIVNQLVPLLKSKTLIKRARCITVAQLFMQFLEKDNDRIPEKYEFYRYCELQGYYTACVTVIGVYVGGYTKFVSILLDYVRTRARYSDFILSDDGHFCMSIGELNLDNLLYKINIKHIPHKHFKFNGKRYKTDQYLPEYDLYIEMDGAPGTEISSLTDGKKLEAYNKLGLNHLILNESNLKKLEVYLNEHKKIS